MFTFNREVSKHAVAMMERDRNYWRKAYETLVKQTGRDLNDGLGLDPRCRIASLSAEPQPRAPLTEGDGTQDDH